MTENEIADVLIDSAMKVHTQLGCGLLEGAYEAALLYELDKRGLRVDRQRRMPVQYEEVLIDTGFRADIVIEDKVIVELKATEEMKAFYKRQLLTYLRFSEMRLGFVLNFGAPRMKHGIVRVANSLEQDDSWPRPGAR